MRPTKLETIFCYCITSLPMGNRHFGNHLMAGICMRVSSSRPRIKNFTLQHQFGVCYSMLALIKGQRVPHFVPARLAILQCFAIHITSSITQRRAQAVLWHNPGFVLTPMTIRSVTVHMWLVWFRFGFFTNHMSSERPAIVVVVEKVWKKERKSQGTSYW